MKGGVLVSGVVLYVSGTDHGRTVLTKGLSPFQYRGVPLYDVKFSTNTYTMLSHTYTIRAGHASTRYICSMG